MSYFLLNFPQFHYEDPETGLPAVDWKVYTFKAGTTELTDTYSNKECTTPNTNPVILDANGNAVIYTNKNLKIILTTPDNDQNTPHLTQDYLNVEQEYYVRGTEVSVVNNLYTVTSTPAQSALTDDLLLIFNPSADNADTFTTQVFTGTGINDARFYGVYTGTTSGSTFEVEIDGIGPDTFKWRKDSEAYTTGVVITGVEQTLKEGITILFTKTSGHTLTDKWTLTTERPVRVNLDGLGAKLVYKNVGGDLQVLDGGDMKAGYPVMLVYTVASDAWTLINQSAPVITPGTVSVERPRKELNDDYTVSLADNGWELSFVGTHAVTLPPASNFANSFVYINNVGTGTITINADGTDVIFFPGWDTGFSSITLAPDDYTGVQLGSNSVDWHTLVALGDPARTVVFTAGETWTRPWYLKFLKGCLCVGGGGAGGGTAHPANTDGGGGGGGGAVAYRFNIDISASATVAVGIGAGGTGSAGANGGDGGDTTFGAFLTGEGGKGGTAGQPGPGTGGAGGNHSLYTLANNHIAFNGTAGGDGIVELTDTGYGGAGGNSGDNRGQGGAATVAPGNGADGGLYGGGGAGSMHKGGAAAYAGGDGTAGFCIIWW